MWEERLLGYVNKELHVVQLTLWDSCAWHRRSGRKMVWCPNSESFGRCCEAKPISNAITGLNITVKLRISVLKTTASMHIYKIHVTRTYCSNGCCETGGPKPRPSVLLASITASPGLLLIRFMLSTRILCWAVLFLLLERLRCNPWPSSSLDSWRISSKPFWWISLLVAKTIMMVIQQILYIRVVIYYSTQPVLIAARCIS